jgi:hypothetical protein
VPWQEAIKHLRAAPEDKEGYHGEEAEGLGYNVFSSTGRWAEKPLIRVIGYIGYGYLRFVRFRYIWFNWPRLEERV